MKTRPAPLSHLLPLLLLLCLRPVVPLTAAPESAFTFTLPAPASTSAGVYDAAGRLVRVLWTMQPRPAGPQSVTWDGNDDAGQAAPAGLYRFQVVANGASYRNLGTIGNSAVPPDSFHHVPINFESLALDRDGAIYTVHDWDEAHHDVIRWSPDTGRVLGHSGHPIGGLLKAIAVDDEYAYVSGYAGEPGKREKVQFFIARLRIDKQANSTRWPLVPFTKAGRQLMVYNGGAALPEGLGETERNVMTIPLLSLAVRGETLYATDSLAGKVRFYDKNTGEPSGSLDAPLAAALALDAEGRLWVGHGLHRVSVFDAAGRCLATPIDDLAEVKALTFGPDGRLYVADRGAGQVRVYGLDRLRATLLRTLGEKARPGDRAPDRFYRLCGLGVDAAGHLVTVQNEFFFNGGRLARFAPDGKPLWEQLGLEFSSTGNYSPDDPDTFHSVMEHSYRLDRQGGGWEYLGNSYTGTPYRGGPGAPLRLGRLGGRDFVFVPGGDGLQVYRLDPPDNPGRGPLRRLVGVLGRASPLPSGARTEECWKRENRFLWSWHDERGDATPHPEDIVYWARPEDGRPLWQYRPITVDAAKDLWITSADRGGITPERNSIWKLPLAGLNGLGNPIYRWQDVRREIGEEALLWPMGMKMAQHADDGTTYVYGHTTRPGAPQHGGAWMGGNALAAFAAGQCRWQIVLPKVCVGLDAIPGGAGGCIVGGNPAAGQLHHYSRDGLLIGICGPAPQAMGAAPNNPSGFLDMYAAVTVNRDPRDGLLDVFVEDNYNLRIAWYRIDDRGIRTFTGTITKPAVP